MSTGCGAREFTAPWGWCKCWLGRGLVGGVKRGSVELIPLPVLWVVGWFLFPSAGNMGVTRRGEGVSFSNPLFCWWACNPYALRLAMYER